jgi:hypothetical protein
MDEASDAANATIVSPFSVDMPLFGNNGSTPMS